jgi:hypothetical protein
MNYADNQRSPVDRIAGSKNPGFACLVEPHGFLAVLRPSQQDSRGTSTFFGETRRSVSSLPTPPK